MAEQPNDTPPTHTNSLDSRFEAIKHNLQVWTLLSMSDRSDEQDHRMLESAYASLLYWRDGGTELNIQRGHWLIARTAVALGLTDTALYHARLCFELRDTDGAETFDKAYAFEAMARSLAALGRFDEAYPFYTEALRYKDLVTDAEDRRYVENDFNSLSWFGLNSPVSGSEFTTPPTT